MVQLGAKVNLIICQKSKILDWCNHMFDNYREKYGWETYDLTRPEEMDLFLENSEDPGCEYPICGVINYELTFRRPKLKNLRNFTLMLDESSLIQNEQAKRSKFILKLNPENVILLSGTPTGGRYERLWSQCRLLGWKINKNLFWSQYVLTEWDEIGGIRIQRITGYQNVDRLKAKLAEHGAVFMKTEEAGVHLPDQNWIHVNAPPNKQYQLFMKIRYTDVWSLTAEEKRVELMGDTPLTLLLYARQLCSMYSEGRVKAFEDLLDSTDDRLIVFYNWTEEMKVLAEICEQKQRPVSYLNGSTKKLRAYETKENSVTFIQYQAGAMGGNFQKANKVIYSSLPLSWELWEQSQKRIHRLGQKRPCFYYLLISPGTVEDHILETLNERKNYNEELFTQYQKKSSM